jgi:hypothetical protein
MSIDRVAIDDVRVVGKPQVIVAPPHQGAADHL